MNTLRDLEIYIDSKMFLHDKCILITVGTSTFVGFSTLSLLEPTPVAVFLSMISLIGALSAIMASILFNSGKMLA